MLQHLITQNDDLRMVPTDHDQLAAAVEKLREELQALPDGKDADRQRMLTRWVGIGLVTLGSCRDAHDFLQQSLALAAAAGNTRAIISTELNLGDAHRYAGELKAADELYRRALDAARTQQPELLDFALQHFAKHLMEQGNLAAARGHLLEARRLRIAKGDTDLIESTQDALDRVELLAAQGGAATDAPSAGAAEATQWSQRWTSWLQSHTTARTPARWAEEFPALRDAVRSLAAHQRVRLPQHLRGETFPAEWIAAMAQEAEKALATDGYVHNGKQNAPVGDAANRFASEVDLAAVVARSTGLEVEEPHNGVYIGYLEEGQFLDFHVDGLGFGDANLILCLKHDRLAAAPTASATVFIGTDGYVEYDLAPGDCVVFDGALTPHGRTPLGAGESVVLVSFGLRALGQAERTVTQLPPVPR